MIVTGTIFAHLVILSFTGSYVMEKNIQAFVEPYDPLTNEFSDIPGLDHPVLENEDAGFRLLSLLADDLDLDAAEIELD